MPWTSAAATTLASWSCLPAQSVSSTSASSRSATFSLSAIRRSQAGSAARVCRLAYATDPSGQSFTPHDHDQRRQARRRAAAADGSMTAGRRPERTLRVANARVAAAADLAGMRVLDLDCAEGLHALYLAQTAAHVLGVDHRQSVIRRAEATPGARRRQRRLPHAPTCARRPPGPSFPTSTSWSPGLLHRITDVFVFLARVAPLAPAISLEWRTRMLPLMNRLSAATYSPAGERLDPTNLPVAPGDAGPGDAAADQQRVKKIEGDTGFWEPTPGAVRTIAGRLGHHHARVLGYGARLSGSTAAMARQTPVFARNRVRHRRAARSPRSRCWSPPTSATPGSTSSARCTRACRGWRACAGWASRRA